jgi:hypothetical protein
MASDMIGKWAFIIGIIIAVIAGFINAYLSTLMFILFLLGLVVGFMNINKKDTNDFLVATIALLVGGTASISALTILGIVNQYITAILGNFIAFVSAAALVVAIKTIVQTTKK